MNDLNLDEKLLLEPDCRTSISLAWTFSCSMLQNASWLDQRRWWDFIPAVFLWLKLSLQADQKTRHRCLHQVLYF